MFYTTHHNTSDIIAKCCRANCHDACYTNQRVNVPNCRTDARAVYHADGGSDAD